MNLEGFYAVLRTLRSKGYIPEILTDGEVRLTHPECWGEELDTLSAVLHSQIGEVIDCLMFEEIGKRLGLNKHDTNRISISEDFFTGELNNDAEVACRQSMLEALQLEEPPRDSGEADEEADPDWDENEAFESDEDD